MSVNSKMVAIADEIRELSGATEAMGLDAMASNVGEANDEIDTQADILAQVVAALDGKSAADTEFVLQTKTVSPSTSKQVITADSDYDALSSVTVNAMTTATQATPSISIDNAGKITATATQSEGYVSAGTKTGTKQLTIQAAKTVTPTTSEQTAVASGVYTTGAVKVAAIPSSYVKPTATKAATTYTPTTSNQTIAAGTYCSGAQTFKGDANLVAGNIKKDVSLFGVKGTYDGPVALKNIGSGTIVYNTDQEMTNTQPVEILHNLGVIPKVIRFKMASLGTDVTTSDFATGVAVLTNDGNTCMVVTTRKAATNYNGPSNTHIALDGTNYKWTDKKVYMFSGSETYVSYVRAGIEYSWIAYG